MRPDIHKMTNSLVQYVTVEQSTSIQWVNSAQTDKTPHSTEFLFIFLVEKGCNIRIGSAGRFICETTIQ